MSEEITRKDWEVASKQYEALLVNGKINAEIQAVALEYCKKKISEMPDDKPADPMPAEVKEIMTEAAQ